MHLNFVRVEKLCECELTDDFILMIVPVRANPIVGFSHSWPHFFDYLIEMSRRVLEQVVKVL
jgi:hypothetical protein